MSSVTRLRSPISSGPTFPPIFLFAAHAAVEALAALRIPHHCHRSAGVCPCWFHPCPPGQRFCAAAGQPLMIPLLCVSLSGVGSARCSHSATLSAATHHFLSQMLGPSVLPPEHCASLLGTFALWGGFPRDPAVQVPELTEFVPM